MKIKSLLVTLLVLISTNLFAKEYAYKEVAGDLMKTRCYELNNGLKVYLSVNKEKPRIQTYIAVRTGSRNDPKETTGLAHYLEHLMFKGTKRFGTTNAVAEEPFLKDIEQRYEKYRLLTNPQERKKAYQEIDSVSQLAARFFIPNEYDKLMSAIGAEGTNAFTSFDVTCYVENIPANEVENWAKIQSDRFQNMVIRGFHTELEAVYEEYNIGLADDKQRSFNALLSKLFPTHPYGTQTTIGTQEHLKNPSITNIKNYFKKYYVPNNVAICMSGDFEPNAVMDIITRYFGEWTPSNNAKPVQAPVYAPVAELKQHKDTVVKGVESELVLLGWKAPKAASYATDTLSVMAKLLSNGKAGLMDLNLEQKMKYLTGGAEAYPFADYGVFLAIGMPKEGQSLNEVKQLILGEINNLKKGKFSDMLLKSVVNNMKLDYYKTLEDNKERTNIMMDAFIQEQSWNDVVARMKRIEGMTKEQIVAFANRFFKDNYACVYKEQGEDASNKKIDKPAITPIPLNREAQSDFLSEVINEKVKPIEPVFVNFDKDLSRAKTQRGVPVLHVKNNTNGLFQWVMRLPFGNSTNKKLNLAADYLGYLGTTKYSAEQLKERFYALACDYNIAVQDYTTEISLEGLSENMEQALQLLKHVLTNARVDKEAYKEYVDLLIKSRNDSKAEQQTNFRALTAYGKYGKYNSFRNVFTNDELKKVNPETLTALLKTLINSQHTLLYYGNQNLKPFVQTMNKVFGNAKLKTVSAGKNYQLVSTTQNKVLLAPYDAKNIYMIQYNNSNRVWTPQNAPIIEVFNEYFGGSMNSVVFQELRETRGLAYSAAASYVSPALKNVPEYAQTYIVTQNDKMMDCIKAFNSIIDTIPQAQAAFDLAKQALTKRIATERVTKMNVIRKYLKAQDLGLNYDINESIYKAIPLLTLQDLVQFEKSNMAQKPYHYIILGDEKNLDMKALEKIAPIERVKTETIFGY